MVVLHPDVNELAARHVQVQAALKAHAQRLVVVARAFAVPHNDSGVYAKSMRVRHGRIDWYVESADPLALHKEFGRTGATGRGASRGVYALTQTLDSA